MKLPDHTGGTMQDTNEFRLLKNPLPAPVRKSHVRMEFDIVTDNKETFRTLYEGIEYTVVAFADDRVSDLDVRVYAWDSGDWTLVKKDSDSSDVAVVSLTPDETARYKIVVSAYSFNSGYSAAHYGIIIFHE